MTFAVALALSCAPRTHDPAEAHMDGELRFDAVLSIDPADGGSQSVRLTEADAGRSWVIADRPEPVWRPFEGLRVSVTGRPRGPAGPERPLELLRLEVEDPDPAVPWVEVGAEVRLEGRFDVRSGEPGSKQEDETWPVFVASDGATWLLAESPEPGGPEAVRIRARPVRRSPFWAHAGGPTLWILETEPR